MDIYIQAAQHISIQKPFSDDWFHSPVTYGRTYVRAIEPDYKSLLTPNIIRRTGKILKRAIVTSRAAVNTSGISMPDAIISGTGLGCIENTEIFLNAMIRNGEELLQPTHFMQSTHNTISSMVAIDLQCNGYNNTCVHRGTSFENALEDACLQFRRGKIRSALVGGHDEMTPAYFLLLSRIGYWRTDSENEPYRKGEEAFAGETSVSFMLHREKTEHSAACLKDVNIMYCPSQEILQQSLTDLLGRNKCSLDDIDAVITGVSGNRANDSVYARSAMALFPDKPVAGYKHIFGESYTAPGLGMYAAVTCIKKQQIPKHMLLNSEKKPAKVKNILLYHHFENKNHSFILLTSPD